MRSVGHVMEELELLRAAHQFNSITWWDDTFTVFPKWINEFCDEYKARGFKAKMAACSRADLICKNEDMIAKLADNGLDWLVIGFESGSQRMLDLLKKGVTVEQNIEAAEICRKYGIKMFGTFMLGLPTESRDEQLATVEMIQTIAPEHPSLFYFTPIPGTDIYDFCQSNGLILRDDEFNIERTNNWTPKLAGVDYEFLDQLRGYVT